MGKEKEEKGREGDGKKRRRKKKALINNVTKEFAKNKYFSRSKMVYFEFETVLIL